MKVDSHFCTTFMPSFIKITQKINTYYATMGEDQHRCCAGYALANRPGLDIGFVPPMARDGLAAMVQNAGITLDRYDRGDSKDAYFVFRREGLTLDKLVALGHSIDAEVARLQKDGFGAKVRAARQGGAEGPAAGHAPGGR